MTKLKHIIHQLSDDAYEALQTQLSIGGANKSSFLLQSLREQKLGDQKIIQQLGLSYNAYYTLCSRLGQKIEDYLLSQIETPRTTLLRKVANLHEVVFGSPRPIAIATLKKLERELRSYDLSAELTLVYKYLKKLFAYSPERFTYSQAYNQQITYTLALDKAENLLMDYFRNYGTYYLQGDNTQKEVLSLHKAQLHDMLAQYNSHRMRVQYAAISVFHRLYVEEEMHEEETDTAPTEHIFREVYDCFAQYPEDPIYPHYVLLFDFLQLAYYHHYGIQRKVDQLYEELVTAAPRLLVHYDGYTFPSQILWIILGKCLRSDTVGSLEQQNRNLFANYRAEPQDLPNYLNYITYRALCCYYAHNYREAANWIQRTFNQLTLKGFTRVQIELKALLALQYVLLDEYDLFTQVTNSMQRQLRLLGKEQLPHLVPFVKILRLAMQDNRKGRETRITELAQQMPMPPLNHFSPTGYVRMDVAFTEQICKIRFVHH